jgi:putative transposase
MAIRIGILLEGGLGMGRRSPFEEQLVDTVPPPHTVGVGMVGAEHLPSSFHGVPPGPERSREVYKIADDGLSGCSTAAGEGEWRPSGRICDQPIDITYIPLVGGFMYLTATIDWYSRYVVGWRLSNTLDGSFCNEMLEAALTTGRPEVFNTDQGVQFTATGFTGRLTDAGVAVSMDGRGRCLDNVFVDRLWRTVKYEDVYLRGYETVAELERGLAAYFRFYNEGRLHQALGYRTPAAVYKRIGSTNVEECVAKKSPKVV